MKTVRLGKTDLAVSRVGMGGIPLTRPTEDEAIRVVRRALDLGVNRRPPSPRLLVASGRSDQSGLLVLAHPVFDEFLCHPLSQICIKVHRSSSFAYITCDNNRSPPPTTVPAGLLC